MATQNGFQRGTFAPRAAVQFPIVGFTEGTMIMCKVNGVEQYVAVQNLRKGMLVKTSLCGFKPVDAIGSRTVTIPDSDAPSADRLYVLSKDKIPSLTQDLTISGRCITLVDSTSDADKRQMIAVLGRIGIVDKKFCLPICAHSDAVLSSTIGETTLYNFSLESTDRAYTYGVLANGLLVTHSMSFHMNSSVYTLIQ
jgi:hypothetical protein